MITVSTILKAVAMEFGVTELDIKSTRRHADVVLPRHVAMYLARRLTSHSMSMIGRTLGDRDHTTVLTGVRRAEARIQACPDLAFAVTSLRKRLEWEAAQCA